MSHLSPDTMHNLQICRELMNREGKGASQWYVDFGPGAMENKPSMDAMINLGSFSKYGVKVQKFSDSESMLVSLREERKKAAAELEAYSKKIYPKYTDVPVSQASVEIFGEEAWHSQARQSRGAESTYSPSMPQSPDWVRRKWGIDHQSHNFIPAHITTKRLEFAKAFSK